MPTYRCPKCGDQHDNPHDIPDQFMLCDECAANGVDKYSGPDERIIEFSSEVGGGLIAFRVAPHTQGRKRLLVDIYCQDSTVKVRVGACKKEAA